MRIGLNMLVKENLFQEQLLLEKDEVLNFFYH